jgi:hypothetical protein
MIIIIKIKIKIILILIIVTTITDNLNNLDNRSPNKYEKILKI